MRKFYFQLFCVLLIASGISSCKVDAPVLPANLVLKGNSGSGTTPGTGTGTNPGTGTGTDLGTGTDTNPGTGTGGDIPIGATNTIKVQIGAGAIKTFTQVNFSSMLGLNNVNGIQNATDIIILGYPGDKTGTFDIQMFSLGDYSADIQQGGKITVTESSMTSTMPAKGTIKGTFTVALVDVDGKSVGTAKGSFNIRQ